MEPRLSDAAPHSKNVISYTSNSQSLSSNHISHGKDGHLLERELLRRRFLRVKSVGGGSLLKIPLSTTNITNAAGMYMKI